MLKKLQIVVALCAIAASFVAVASASALTVTVSPGGATTATGTTGSILTITSGSTSKSLTCSSENATATLAPSSSGVVSTNVALHFPATTGGTCNLVGGAAITATCTSTSILTVTGVTVSGVTPGTLSNISCTVALTSAPTCRVSVAGSVRGQVTNSTSQLRIFSSGQSLTASGSTCTATFPNGSGAFTADPSGDLLLTQSPAQTVNAV